MWQRIAPRPPVEHATTVLLGVLALAVLCGCSGALGGGDGDSADDDSALADDDSAPGDDDSATPSVPPVDSATFAATLTGSVEYGAEADWVTTALEGRFHIYYWNGGEPSCRTAYRFSAFAAWGPAAAAEFDGCSGGVTLWSAEPIEVADEDGCGDRPCLPPCALPVAQDLSFLLAPGEGAPATDFRTMAAVSAERLGSAWVLGDSGLTVAELAASFGAVDLELSHLLFVRPEGWLAGEAALGGVAAPWGLDGWLPMFAVYREAGDAAMRPYLGGAHFWSSIWTLDLRAP